MGEGAGSATLSDRWTTSPVADYPPIKRRKIVAAQVVPDESGFDWLALLRCGHVKPINGTVSAAMEISCYRCTQGEPNIALPDEPSVWLGEAVDEAQVGRYVRRG